jgi:hypothetical protein
MRVKQLAVFALSCALPLVVLADPPGKGRSGGGPGGPGDRGGQHNRPEAGGDRSGGNFKPFSEWTDEDRKQFATFKKELADFCETNSPNRWKDIQKKDSERGDRPSGMVGQMAMRFRFLKTLEKEDPELFEIKRSQIRVEDEEYGLIKARTNLADPEKSAEKDAIDQKLRETAKQYVSLRLKERELRIKKLDQLLKKEMEEVKADATASGDLAQKHFDKISAMTPEQLLAPGRGGGGNHGGGPRDGGNGPNGPGGPGGGPGGPPPGGPNPPPEN